MCFSRHAVYLATFFMLLFSSPTLAFRPSGPPPGCFNGRATGNPQCQPAPSTNTETTNTHPNPPVSNQIGGSGGTSNPPTVLPQTPPPQTLPGYLKYPNFTGKRDPITGYPIPPNPPVGQVPQPIEQKVPKPQPYNVPGAQQTLPGYLKYPNFTGKRDPITGYPIPPNPPVGQVPQPIEQKVPKPQPL